MKRKSIIDMLKGIAKYNESVMDSGEQEKAYSFEHDGMEIVDPFVDESGRFEVKPLEYYGEDKCMELIESWISK